MVSFADEIAASLPARLTLPGEFRQTLDWMEANGFVHHFRDSAKRYGSLYPASLEGRGTSLVSFQPTNPDHVKHWARSGAADEGRLAPLIRTGGDGSWAALWLDHDGRQRFVHLGSGSGSTMMCVLCDSPVDMLRLMAIGYDELCWPEHFALTPQQALLENPDAEPYVGPSQFRAYVETTFGVTIPATASGIVKQTADMDAPASDDPFWTWIRSFD